MNCVTQQNHPDPAHTAKKFVGEGMAEGVAKGVAGVVQPMDIHHRVGRWRCPLLGYILHSMHQNLTSASGPWSQLLCGHGDIDKCIHCGAWRSLVGRHNGGDALFLWHPHPDGSQRAAPVPRLLVNRSGTELSIHQLPYLSKQVRAADAMHPRDGSSNGRSCRQAGKGSAIHVDTAAELSLSICAWCCLVNRRGYDQVQWSAALEAVHADEAHQVRHQVVGVVRCTHWVLLGPVCLHRARWSSCWRDGADI